jgi:hypothetical protein
MNSKDIRASNEELDALFAEVVEIAMVYADTFNLKKRRAYWHKMRAVQDAFKKRHGALPTFKVSRGKQSKRNRNEATIEFIFGKPRSDTPPGCSRGARGVK